MQPGQLSPIPSPHVWHRLDRRLPIQFQQNVNWLVQQYYPDASVRVLTGFHWFNRPYLQAGKREALADYSLPVAVITLSFVGSYLFQDVTVERFRYDDKNVFMVAPLERLSWLAVLGAMGMGFSLSLLFFMDQNITSAMVNNPCNKWMEQHTINLGDSWFN